MKNIMKVLVLVSMTLLWVTGCTSGKSVQVPSDYPQNVKIFEANDGFVLFTNQLDISDKKNAFKKSYESLFGAFVKYGESKGYKYFAITNEDVNNLQGFPINTMKDFYVYNLKGKFNQTGKTGYSFLKGSTFEFKIVYFKEKPSNLFLFNVENIKNEIKTGWGDI